MDQCRILVTVRLKPPNDDKVWVQDDTEMSIADARTQEQWSFDKVFPSESSTEKIYSYLVKDIVASFADGFNGTIFAYGQTASGKTYTMHGDQSTTGIIPLAVHDLFRIMESKPDTDYLMSVSYVEIYNEKIVDLLIPDGNNAVTLYDRSDGTMDFRGMSETRVTEGPEDVFDCLHRGETRRHIGETKMNERSSRSHTILRINLESQEKGETRVKTSLLNLVDLAGTEGLRHTGGLGEQRRREGANINKSLLSLCKVINQLSEAKANAFVGFRDSQLTRILQNSIGGNSKTAIIACCSCEFGNYSETRSTLDFALRAQKVKNKVKANIFQSEGQMLQEALREIEKLKTQLQHYESSSPGSLAEEELRKSNDEVFRLTELLAERTQAIPRMLLAKYKPISCLSPCRRPTRRQTIGAAPTEKEIFQQDFLESVVEESEKDEDDLSPAEIEVSKLQEEAAAIEIARVKKDLLEGKSIIPRRGSVGCGASDKNDAVMKLAKTIEEKEKLADTLKKVRQENESLKREKKKNNDGQDAQARIAQLVEENSRLTAQNDQMLKPPQTQTSRRSICITPLGRNGLSQEDEERHLVESLQSQVDHLRVELKKKTNDLGTAKDRMKIVERAHQVLEATAESQRQDLLVYTKQNEELRNQLAQAERNVANLTEELDSQQAQKRIRHLEEVRLKDRRLAEKLQTENDALQKNMLSLQEHADEVNKKLAEATLRENKLVEEIHSLRAAAKANQSMLKELKEEKDAVELELKNCSANFERTKTQLEARCRALEQPLANRQDSDSTGDYDKRLEELQSHCSLLQDECEKARAENSKLAEAGTRKDLKQEENQKEIAGLYTKLQQYEERMDELKTCLSEREEKEEEDKNLKQEVADLHIKLKRYEDEMNSTHERAQSETDKHLRREEEILTLHAKLQHYEAQIHELNDSSQRDVKHEEDAREIASLTTKLKHYEAQLYESSQKDVKQDEDRREIVSLQTRLKHYEAKIDELNDSPHWDLKHEEDQREIASLHTRLKHYENQLDELNKSISNEMANNAGKDEKKEEDKKEIAGLYAKLHQYEEGMNELKTCLSDERTEKATISIEMDRLKKEWALQEKTIACLNSGLEETQTMLQEWQSKADSLHQVELKHKSEGVEKMRVELETLRETSKMQKLVAVELREQQSVAAEKERQAQEAIQEVETRLRVVQEEGVTLKEGIGVLREEKRLLEDLVAKLEKPAQEVEEDVAAKLAQRDLEIDRLREEITCREGSEDKGKIVQLERELQDTALKSSTWEEKYRASQAKLRSIEADKDFGVYVEMSKSPKPNSNEGYNSMLKRTMLELRKSTADVRDKDDEIDTLSDEVKVLRVQMQKLQSWNCELLQECEKSTAKCEVLSSNQNWDRLSREQLDDLYYEIESMKVSQKDNEKYVRDAQRELEIYQKKVALLGVTQKENEQLKETIKDLEYKLLSLKSSADGLRVRQRIEQDEDMRNFFFGTSAEKNVATSR